MYCYVIFGESDDKHTRKYLYKCDELTPGDTVIVPVKNSQKIALVYNTFKTIPDVCLFYVEEPGEASEKELNFWKGLKDIEYQLRYGYSYRKKDKRSINIKTDPIELTDEYLKIELELERLIRKEIGEGGYMGFCHKYWWTKKNLLKEKYGIEWKSPVDMNPGVNFD